MLSQTYTNLPSDIGAIRLTTFLLSKQHVRRIFKLYLMGKTEQFYWYAEKLHLYNCG